MSSWVMALWGRERLRQRVSALEYLLKRARKAWASVAATNELVINENRRLGQTVAEYENANKELAALVEQYEKANRRVDPNAQCPNCGHRNGFLTHAVGPNGKEVRPVNNCKECGFTFCSSAPIAGEETAAAAYQPSQAIVRSQKG